MVCVDERPRKDFVAARLLVLAAHVDQLDLGQRAIHHAVAQFDPRVFAALGIVPAFERRRSRAHDHHRAGQLGAHHGHVARVVARRFLLLVALVVLLVDQNQPQVGRGGKDSRARADDDGRVAAADATPLLAALLGRERGVQQRDLLPEGGVEQAGGLRREADLRHEQDGRQAAVESLLHGGEIDGSFSRTSYAIKQKGMECPERNGERGQRIGLRGVEAERRGRGRQAAEAKQLRPLLDAHQPAPHQSLQSRRGQIAAAQFGERQFAAAGRKLGQNCLLLFGQRGQARVGNEHGKALHAPRIALGGRGLARDPLFAQHGGQKRQRCRGRRAQRGDFDRLTRGQPLQHAMLHVVAFGRKLLRTARARLGVPSLDSLPWIAVDGLRPARRGPGR